LIQTVTLKNFAALGANILNYEACTHLHRTLSAIKAEGMKAGVAINPHTNIDLLEDVINDIDLVCIMSKSWFWGQYLSKTSLMLKVAKLKALYHKKGSEYTYKLMEV
jgi:ribulose-phosphate 3-epimerase